MVFYARLLNLVRFIRVAWRGRRKGKPIVVAGSLRLRYFMSFHREASGSAGLATYSAEPRGLAEALHFGNAVAVGCSTEGVPVASTDMPDIRR